MDIWPEVTIPATYAAWLSVIDTEAASGAVVKRTIGQDSYSHDVHMYEAGHGLRRALIVAGTHPFEFVGQAAAKQFFVQFATSDHPAMVALREQVTIYWIPALIPGDFKGGRENANGVNVNRNYDLNHAGSADPYKGVAPFDQPESTLVKSVIDTYKPSLVIDCHNYGSTGQSDMAYGSTRIVHGKPGTVYKAVEMWKRANPDLTETMRLLDDSNRDATLGNWSQKYIRFDKGDSSAMYLLIECLSTLAGSTTSNITRRAIRLYASLIYQGVLSWLESGQMDETPLTRLAHAVHSISTGFDTPVQDGGRLVSSTAWVPVVFATSSSSSNLPLLEVPLPYPGRIRVDGSVNLVRSGSNSDPVRVDIGVSYASRYGAPAATGPIASTVRSVQIGVSQTVSLETFFQSPLIAAVPAENIFAIVLWIRTTADQNVRITSNNMVSGAGGGARLLATTEPSFEPFIRPMNGF